MQPFLFPPYSLFLSSSSATLRRHSRIPSATRARRANPFKKIKNPQFAPSQSQYDTGADSLSDESLYRIVVWQMKMNTHVKCDFLLSFKVKESGALKKAPIRRRGGRGRGASGLSGTLRGGIESRGAHRGGGGEEGGEEGGRGTEAAGETYLTLLHALLWCRL